MKTKMASNSKSLEEMLASEVDESEISALVGSLETQLERPMTQDMNSINMNAINSVNHVSKANHLESINTNSVNTQQINNNNNINNNVNNALTQSLNTIISNNNNNSDKRIVINNNLNNINSSAMSANTNSTNSNININVNNNNNKLLTSTSCAPLPGALPASGYISQVTNSSNSALNSVQNTIPTNQILQNAIKVSAMPNGSPNPSPLQQSLQTPAQQLSSLQSTTRPSTTIALSAISSPSLVFSQNKLTTTGAKPGQTLLIATTKDGPMLVQPSNQTHLQNINNSNNDSLKTTTTGVSVPTTSSVVTIQSRNMISGNTSGQQNTTLMQHLVQNSVSNPIQFQLVTNVNPSRPQTNPNIGTQKTLAPRVIQLTPNPRPGTVQVIRPGTNPGFASQGTITLPSNLVRAGTIFVKTENGQVHMVNVAPQMPPNANSANPQNIQSYRLQVPASATGQTAVRNLGPNQHIVLPVSVANALHNKSAQQSPAVQVSQPLTIQTSAANAQAGTTPSQMSPNTAKKKCKNFLSTLIRLASDQPDQVANNVRNLIQGLIDDTIQPEDFTTQLQKELNSSPQPCLIPFLRKSLPYLRYSLMQRELTIDGVRPPPHGAVSLPPQSQAIPQIQIAQTPQRPGMPPTVRLLTPLGGQLMGGQSATVLTPITQTAASARLTAPQNIIRPPITQTSASRSTSKSSSSKSRTPSTKEKEKKNNFASSHLRDDDDINDVAAMGGVNLQEESQRILASNAEIVGQQIRSCKDENFLYTTPLHTRINKIASKFGLDECPPDVVSLVSHAVQERLKNLVEKLGVIAEHRQEQLKNDPRYEILQDVKGQVQFLQELDRIEKRKHEEQEREVLIKAAKSRSKADDPDHIAIKMRAKEMQRQEMEELRQKEANETALQAIGNPKKRLKTLNTVTPSNSVSFASSSSSTGLNSSTFSSTPLKPMRRIKRVSIRDLYFLMEQQKETVRTPMLYRAYAK